jgi:hypothetical protein
MGLFRLELTRFVGTLALVAACAASGAWGQGAAAPGEAKTIVSMPPTPLLPQAFSSLTSSGMAPQDSKEIDSARFNSPGCAIDTGAQPATPSGPCAGVLKEDGLVRLAAGVYTGAGSRKVTISAFEFGDASGAYSAYTFFRSMMQGGRLQGGEARLSKRSGETTLGGDDTLVWAGTAILHVQGHVTTAELSALEVRLPKVGGRRSLAPLEPTMFPTEVGGAKIEPETLRYALGPAAYKAMGGVLPPDILGWDKSAEVATASYAGKGGKGTLTLLLYPTPQIAGDRGRAIEKAVNGENLGTVKMRRLGPLVGVTSGNLPPEQAEGLIHAMQLNEIVTFDKPMPLEFHAEVRKTATLLQSIAIFTGTLILAAIVIGVFLGGARAGIRVLRGKPAASEPEFLTINLREKPMGFFAPKGSGQDQPPSGS